MAIFNTKTILKWKDGYTIKTTYLYGIPIKTHAYKDESEPYTNRNLPQGARTPWAGKWMLKAGNLEPQQVSHNNDYSYIQYKHLDDEGLLFGTWEEAMKAKNSALSAIHPKP